MQTFLPLPNFHETALVLDKRRRGNQRLEAKDVLYVCCRHNGLDLASVLGLTGKQTRFLWKRYRNHPVVPMWLGSEFTLAQYGVVMCNVWIADGCVDNQKPYFLAAMELLPDTGMPSWFGDEDFHRRHRSNLLRKKPEHYRRLWPDERDDLPYIWPKNLKGELKWFKIDV